MSDIVVKKTSDKPRSFFDNIDKWAKDDGSIWISLFYYRAKRKKYLEKVQVNFSEESIKEIMKISKANINDSIFFSCGKIRRY